MFKDLVYSLITKGTVALINFLILIISSRYLGVSSRGEISIFILNITVIQIINEVYTGYNIIHFIPKFNLKKIAAFGIFYTLVFCTLSNTLIVFFNKQVPGYEWLGYFISLAVIINTFHCVLILGKQNIKAYNMLSFIQPFILLMGLTFWIFFLKNYTFAAYVYPLALSFLVALCISSTKTAGLFNQSTNTGFSFFPIVINGFFFQVSSLLLIFANRYSYYLLPDAASVGLYSSASSLMEAVLIIVNSISPVLLSKVANQGNTLKNVQTTLSLSKASFLFSTLVVLFVFLLPDTIFLFILGEGFVGIKDLMIRYAPGILFVSLFASMSNYLFAIGKQKLVFICYACSFLLTLLLTPALIRKYGTAGAAYTADITYCAMAIAICISFGVTTRVSLRHFFSFKRDYLQLKELIASRL